MLFIRLPLVVALAWIYKKSLTDPNPPPPAKELIHAATLFDSKRKFIQYTPKFRITVNTLLAFFEIVTLLSSELLNHGDAGSLWFAIGNLQAHSIHFTLATSMGAALMLIGGGIRLWCFARLGSFFRFEPSIQKDHSLITGGPYSWVRHPSYTGWVLLQAGWLLWNLGEGSWLRACGILNSLWGMVAFAGFSMIGVWIPMYFLLNRIGAEDAALRQKFGSVWEEYAERVPSTLIPGVL